MYVLTTDVLANYAGPGIILSFLVAGIATFFAGIILFTLINMVLIIFYAMTILKFRFIIC